MRFVLPYKIQKATVYSWRCRLIYKKRDWWIHKPRKTFCFREENSADDGEIPLKPIIEVLVFWILFEKFKCCLPIWFLVITIPKYLTDSFVEIFPMTGSLQSWRGSISYLDIFSFKPGKKALENSFISLIALPGCSLSFKKWVVLSASWDSFNSLSNIVIKVFVIYNIDSK